MLQTYDNDFWKAVDALVSSGKIIIDRPKESVHPRFPNIEYKVDYGYIAQHYLELPVNCCNQKLMQ